MASDRKSSVTISENSNGFTTQLIKTPSAHADTRKVSISEVPRPEALARRRSTFKGLVRNLVNIGMLFRGRPSLTSSTAKSTVKIENTYKMEPDHGKAMNSDRIYRLVEDILNVQLKNVKYDAKTCSTLACDLSNLIKNRVKRLNIPRYKVVCEVVIGQSRDQGTQIASRCLWNPHTDTYQEVTYNNNSLFAVVMVFGVYFE